MIFAFLLYLTGNLLTLRYRSILPAIVLNLTFYTCDYLQTVAVELLPNVSIYFPSGNDPAGRYCMGVCDMENKVSPCPHTIIIGEP